MYEKKRVQINKDKVFVMLNYKKNGIGLSIFFNSKVITCHKDEKVGVVIIKCSRMIFIHCIVHIKSTDDQTFGYFLFIGCYIFVTREYLSYIYMF